jgi:hypothetical protein
VRRLLLPLVVVSAFAPKASAEAYEVSAETALTLDREGQLSQSWTAACVGTDVADGATIRSAGKDLRYVEALDEPLEQGVDPDTFAVDGAASGRYVYTVVPGARVFARLSVRCGSDDVFDEVVVDSAPVTLAPSLSPPSRVVDADTLVAVSPDAIAVGSTVELVGVVVAGSPRGSERIVVRFSGAGVDGSVELSQEDFADGRATLSPQLTVTSVGQITIEAELAGAVSAPAVLTVVPIDEAPPPGFVGDDSAAGCAAMGGSDNLLAGSALVLGAVVRRRRRARPLG